MSKRYYMIIGLLSIYLINYAAADFKEDLDDFSWYLGDKYQHIYDSRPASLFTEIKEFTVLHAKEYFLKRKENLKKIEALKIDTEGFEQLNSTTSIEKFTQELAQTSLADVDAEYLGLQYWKVLDVETMTALLSNQTMHLLRDPSLDYSLSDLASLYEKKYLFGYRYVAVPCEENIWDIWAYSYGPAYKYRWDIVNNKISAFSIWIKKQ